MSGEARLMGDIGATNARFALCGDDGRATRVRVLPVDSFPTLGDAIRSYLAQERIVSPLAAAALAVASPITGDAVTLTNHPWSFSISALKRDLGVRKLTVINDFTAQALAVRHLAANERVVIGGGSAVPENPIGVIGPGTGLGVSGLIPSQSGWVALAGEGGHVTFAAVDDKEADVIALLRRRFTHVSGERVLSGQGLVNLYQALAEIEGVPAESYTPAQITNRELGEREPLCRAAVAMFCAMLGSMAGDLALTLGARGGIYIAGGIVPRLGTRLAESAFRERFESKGRFRSYLSTVPTYVMTAEVPAFLGLAEVLALQETS